MLEGRRRQKQEAHDTSGMPYGLLPLVFLLLQYLVVLHSFFFFWFTHLPCSSISQLRRVLFSIHADEVFDGWWGGFGDEDLVGNVL